MDSGRSAGGDILFRGGDPADRVFRLRSGAVEIVREVGGQAVVMGTVGPKHFVRGLSRRAVEVRAGIEPAYADLQSAASPLCHRTFAATSAYINGARATVNPGVLRCGGAACNHGPPVPARRGKMDSPVIDFIAARNMMVDGQVRPNRVADRRVLDAMRRLPRERFVPPQAIPLAYADEDVPLGDGRVLMEPMVIARLVQLADVQTGERVLVVGAGPGYGSALLAACGAQVTALEQDEALRALARPALAGITGVTLVGGLLRDGWREGAPYDVVFIEGAADEIPPALLEQIRMPGGRLVGVMSAAGRIGHAGVGEPSAGGLSFQPAFDCATPVLPALRRQPGFVF